MSNDRSLSITIYSDSTDAAVQHEIDKIRAFQQRSRFKRRKAETLESYKGLLLHLNRQIELLDQITQKDLRDRFESIRKKMRMEDEFYGLSNKVKRAAREGGAEDAKDA